LESVDLAGLAARWPSELSAGQCQRVAIARALVGSRHVLLADEPTGALDSLTAEEVMLTLRTRIDAGVAGVLVTHDPRMAAWADRVVFLRDGLVIDTASPPDPELALRRQP
jgi:putative ABC transport system ATP-binding protein